jgi:hypothetical protein
LENLWFSFFETKFAAWNTLGADRIAVRHLELLTLCNWFSAQKLKTFLSTGVSPEPEELQDELNELFSPTEVYLDPFGRVVTGEKSLILGEGAQDLHLGLSAEIKNLLAANPGSWVGYWNWTTQPLTPEFLLSDWLAWLKDGKILASGPLEVSFEAWKRYPFGYFGVFAPGFRPASLEIREFSNQRNTSFLKKALRLREQGQAQSLEQAFPEAPGEESLESLPMIPFTLRDLEDPHFVWPQGLENLDLSSFKARLETPKRPAPVPEENLPEPEAPFPVAEPQAPWRGRLLLATLLSLGLGLWLAAVQTLPVLDILAEFK